jgi:hypothetical protein
MNEQVYFVDVQFAIKLQHISRKEAMAAEAELLEVLHKHFEFEANTGTMQSTFTAKEYHSHKV